MAQIKELQSDDLVTTLNFINFYKSFQAKAKIKKISTQSALVLKNHVEQLKIIFDDFLVNNTNCA